MAAPPARGAPRRAFELERYFFLLFFVAFLFVVAFFFFIGIRHHLLSGSRVSHSRRTRSGVKGTSSTSQTRETSPEKCSMRWIVEPPGRAAGMWQRDEGHPGAYRGAPDSALHRYLTPEALDRETTDEKDHGRTEQRELLLEPGSAEGDLLTRGPPIAAARRRLSGKALRYRGPVRKVFRIDTRLCEPPPKLRAGASAERLSRRELNGARRLTNDGDAIGYGAGDNGSRALEVPRVDALGAGADPRVKARERSRTIDRRL